MTTSLLADHHGESALERVSRRSEKPRSALERPTPDLRSELEAPTRAPRISQEEVFAAADALLLEGRRPTIDRVRMRLGRGSPNTINDHLDLWWTRLGARLRDLPGQEFPQLPPRVASSLQKLWNDALEGAHEALRTSIATREQALVELERAVALRETQLAEASRTQVARAAALEEHLALARSQLTESNRRSAALEEALKTRDEMLTRVRERLEKIEETHAVFVQGFEAERAAHFTERARLEERYEATEKRWLTEVDQTRQALKESERRLREMQRQLVQVQVEREQTRLELTEGRAQLNTALAVRAQLEERLRLVSKRDGKATASQSSRRQRTTRSRSSSKKASAAVSTR